MTAADSIGANRPSRRGIGLLAGVVLGVVFLIAAWAKAIDPVAFAEQIAAEGLDFLIPANLLAPAVVVLEAVLGLALLLGLRQRWVLWPTGMLVALFIFLTGRGYWRFLNGIEEPTACGCFGNLMSRTPAEAFWQDLMLLVPPFLLACWFRDAVPRIPRWRLVAVAAIGLTAAVLVWRAPYLPLDDMATRLKPGSRVTEVCAGSADDAGERACLDLLVPELGSGRHVALIGDLEDPELGAEIGSLNDLARNLQSSESGALLWLLHDSTPEVQTAFYWQWGPAFQIREVPETLLRPMYRSRPRSFVVEEGVVIRTWNGLPSVEEIASGER